MGGIVGKPSSSLGGIGGALKLQAEQQRMQYEAAQNAQTVGKPGISLGGIGEALKRHAAQQQQQYEAQPSSTLGSTLGRSLGGIGEALKRYAEQRQQQKQYEAAPNAQIEAAKLASSNTIDNVANIQTGDALQTIDGLTYSKKKKQGASISSALGVV